MCVSPDTPDLRGSADDDRAQDSNTPSVQVSCVDGQAQRLSLKRWYETVTINKQLDSDRRAAYVPDAGRPRGLAHEEDENTLGSAGTHEVLDQSLYLKHRQQPSALSLGARAHGDAQPMGIPKNP